MNDPNQPPRRRDILLWAACILAEEVTARRVEIAGMVVGILLGLAVFGLAEAIAHTWHPFEAASDAFPPSASAPPAAATEARGGMDPRL